MDTINAGSMGEREALVEPKNQARRKLKRAVEGDRETRHLPPGNDDRDAAVEELHWAEAVAAEMCL